VIFVDTEFIFLIIVLSGFTSNASFTINVSSLSMDGISSCQEMIIPSMECLCVESINLIELLCVSFECVDGRRFWQ